MPDNNPLKIANKIDDISLKGLRKEKKEKKRGWKLKLGCCAVVFAILVVIFSFCAFLWLGGHAQKWVCSVVEDNSQISNAFQCTYSGKLEQKQEGEGEYKYNIIDNGEVVKISDIESIIIGVVENSSASVVGIGVSGDEFNPSQVIGTGFIITENGLIVTNQHVVSNNGVDYFVMLQGESEAQMVKEVYRDSMNDIAILKIEKSNLSALPLGDSDQLKVGQTVIAIGNALGDLEGTVTSGIISGLNRDVQVGSGFFQTSVSTFEGVIQTDAAINPGNSGGPLLNSQGEVIGVSFATIEGADNLSFALPINRIKNRIEELNKYGDFRIPFLGVEYRQRVVFFNDQALVGAVIVNVVEDSPAETAKIKKNDIIVQFDGDDLGKGSLASLIQQKEIGDKVEIVVIRNKKQVTLEVVIGDRADFN